MPIIHHYFVSNYKTEMIMENRVISKWSGKISWLFAIPKLLILGEQWTREGLLCQERFKTQTYTCGILLNLFLISVLISLWGRSRWQSGGMLGWPPTMITSKYIYTWINSCWKQPGDQQENLSYNQTFKERSTWNQVGREKKWMGPGSKPLAGDTEEEWGYPRLRDLPQESNHI